MGMTMHGNDFTTGLPASVFTPLVTFVLLASCTGSGCGGLCFYDCGECTKKECSVFDLFFSCAWCQHDSKQ